MRFLENVAYGVFRLCLIVAAFLVPVITLEAILETACRKSKRFSRWFTGLLRRFQR